jgi:hypothetical protein
MTNGTCGTEVRPFQGRVLSESRAGGVAPGYSIHPLAGMLSESLANLIQDPWALPPAIQFITGMLHSVLSTAIVSGNSELETVLQSSQYSAF